MIRNALKDETVIYFRDENLILVGHIIEWII